MVDKSQQLSLVACVAETIDAHGLIPRGGRVLVAVSGGVDSVAMLSALRELARRRGRAWRLCVAHLDHALRAESAGDAAFVGKIARRMRLPFYTRRCDVRAMAEASGAGIEEAARDARYQFLLAAAREARCELVAVAHHADDNAETVLHRVLRGTAVKGLCGIPIRRELSNGSDLLSGWRPQAQSSLSEAQAQLGGATRIQLIRPMLHCRREQIVAYARRQGLAWREDSSNADASYRRNYIRHHLLPAIRENVSPGAVEALLRLARHAAEIDRHLTREAEELLRECGMGILPMCSTGILPVSARVADVSSACVAGILPASALGMGGSVAAATVSPVSEGRPQQNNEDRGGTPLEHTGKMPVPHAGGTPATQPDADKMSAGHAGKMPASHPDAGETPATRLDAEVLSSADAAVQAAAMRIVLERTGLPMREVGRQRLCELRAMLAPGGPKAISLGGGVEARREGKWLVIGRKSGTRRSAGAARAGGAGRPVSARLSQCDTPAGSILAPGKPVALPAGGTVSLVVESLDRAALEAHIRAAQDPGRARRFGEHVEYLDADKVRGALIARPRRVGDRFAPLGSKGSTSVSDFLTDLKLPHELRRRAVCLCDDLGVVCLWPLRIDRRARVTARTARVIKVIGRSCGPRERARRGREVAVPPSKKK